MSPIASKSASCQFGIRTCAAALEVCFIVLLALSQSAFSPPMEYSLLSADVLEILNAIPASISLTFFLLICIHMCVGQRRLDKISTILPEVLITGGFIVVSVIFLRAAINDFYTAHSLSPTRAYCTTNSVGFKTCGDNTPGVISIYKRFAYTQFAGALLLPVLAALHLTLLVWGIVRAYATIQRSDRLVHPTVRPVALESLAHNI